MKYNKVYHSSCKVLRSNIYIYLLTFTNPFICRFVIQWLIRNPPRLDFSLFCCSFVSHFLWDFSRKKTHRNYYFKIQIAKTKEKNKTKKYFWKEGLDRWYWMCKEFKHSNIDGQNVTSQDDLPQLKRFATFLESEIAYSNLKF